VVQKLRTGVFLNVSLSNNPTRFVKFFYCLKEEKFPTTLTERLPPHLKYIAALPCEATDMFKYAANLEENKNKMH